MTNDEVKDAFFKRKQVLYNGTEYSIQAMRYAITTRGRLVIGAELLDKNQNSVVVAPIRDISLATENEGDMR